MEELTPTELKARLDAGETFSMVDVREPDEWENGTLPGIKKIPMGDVQARIEELDKNRPVVVVCRSGGRSRKICELLESQGFSCINLAGGMNGWSDEVDSTVRRY